MKKMLALILALVLLGTTGLALADYPDKPVTLYCGYSAGGSSDLLCRILAQKLQEKIGATVVVQNKKGGGGWEGGGVSWWGRGCGYELSAICI